MSEFRAEARGRTAKEAVANAFALMDRYSKGRKKSASERVSAYRTRSLGRGQWVVYFRELRGGRA